jgi:hypothetical protein
VSLVCGHVINVAPQTANGLDGLVVGIAFSAARAYTEIDVRTFCTGELSDVPELRKKLLAAQPFGRPSHATPLPAFGEPTLDESDLYQFVGQEQCR